MSSYDDLALTRLRLYALICLQSFTSNNYILIGNILNMETRGLKLNLKTKKREKWRRRNELKLPRHKPKTIDATLKLINDQHESNIQRCHRK